jgi:hypothetical protein
MCNDYEQHVRWTEYCKMMRDLELHIPTRQTELDLPPKAGDIKINNRGPIKAQSVHLLAPVARHRGGASQGRPPSAEVHSHPAVGERPLSPSVS